MSSQGLNSTAFNANTNYIRVAPASGIGAGIPSGFRIESSSDYINQLNQKAIYQKPNPTDFSNSTRLKLQFARQICPGCPEGPFPA
jgi:hypothetical protein